MAEFDRAALAAAAAGKQTQAGNGLFWGAVIALPVLGLVVGGLLFALPGKPKSPVQLSQTTAPATEQAETQTAETEPEPVSPEQKAYEASDSLPDENDKRTAEATDEMQSPKIYDTKEYFVPIKKTAHSHGGVGIAIAGLVSAAVVAAAVYLASIYLL